jgi:hypothetical protein
MELLVLGAIAFFVLIVTAGETLMQTLLAAAWVLGLTSVAAVLADGVLRLF